MIAGLRDLGKTVFLTTHYMEEAQRLADRVAIIAGRRGSSPQGRPDELGGREARPAEIRFRLPGRAWPPATCPAASRPRRATTASC